MSIFCDWSRNSGNIKGRLILLLFRISNRGSRKGLLFIILLPYLILYRLIVEWILGIEIPYKTQIGGGLILYHGQGLVINDGTIIGKNCTLRHNTTIGNKELPTGKLTDSPKIGNGVNIGSNVCIIGPISIGDNVIIGAGSVVTKDIPKNSVAVGNPARIIRTIK
jgi:putative colanic acid biosynthesis acetyltransferase WcaB